MSTKSDITENESENQNKKEEDLRKLLRKRLQGISRREPLEPTYRHHIINRSTNFKQSALLPRDPLYTQIKSKLRLNVEKTQAHGIGILWSRKRGRERDAEPEDRLDPAKMRAAFTLRQNMRHEQQLLVANQLQAEKNAMGMIGHQRLKEVEDLASVLQSRERKQKEREILLRAKIAQEKKEKMQKEKAKQEKTASEKQRNKKKMELDLLIREEEMALAQSKQRELNELKMEEDERLRKIQRRKERERMREESMLREEENARRQMEQAREEQVRKNRMAETPQEATHRLYEPIFRALWDMEFEALNGTNPFRMVIDADNCAAMGVPDYIDVVGTPMNLTYIKDKVDKKDYLNFGAFLHDVQLMIQNALKYNSDPNNEYHKAAKLMKTKFTKDAKAVLQNFKKKG